MLIHKPNYSVIAAGVVDAITPSDGLTPLQHSLMHSVFEMLYGHDLVLNDPGERFWAGVPSLSTRAQYFAGYVYDDPASQEYANLMILGAFVLRPLPAEVVERIEAYFKAMNVDDTLLGIARQMVDVEVCIKGDAYEQIGYTQGWTNVDKPWSPCTDEQLFAMWDGLSSLPPDTIGYQVHRFYIDRGFRFPGHPDGAAPLLSQHDWVHVLADYGSKVDAELEVFAFIAMAAGTVEAFALLAMVVSLFESGLLCNAADGFFERHPDNLSLHGCTIRVADAMRRGRAVAANMPIDFMSMDWFAVADLKVETLRQTWAVPPKSLKAIEAGSKGPFEQGGISEFQLQQAIDVYGNDDPNTPENRNYIAEMFQFLTGLAKRCDDGSNGASDA